MPTSTPFCHKNNHLLTRKPFKNENDLLARNSQNIVNLDLKPKQVCGFWPEMNLQYVHVLYFFNEYLGSFATILIRQKFVKTKDQKKVSN